MSGPKSCGGCTMCCKLMTIVELDKPANVWCRDCAIGVGCKIYETRPESCRVFECGYLTYDVSETLRPDRSHVVFFAVEDKESSPHQEEQRSLLRRGLPAATIVFLVDKGYEDKWQHGPARALADHLLAKGEVIVVVTGSNRKLLVPESFRNDPRAKELR